MEPIFFDAMGIQQDFVREVEVFLKWSGMSPSTFGRQVVHDPKFVRDLRNGRAPSIKLYAKVNAFMAKRRSAAKAEAAE
jgi:hypothetical protein